MENNDFFEISLPQQSERAYGADRKPKKPFKRTMTINMLIEWIKDQNYEGYIKEKLIVMVKNQPSGALNNFKDNIEKYVNSIIINNRKKD
jgi:hypothetical protein